MSNVLKLSGPLKIGSLATDPINPANGFIYFNTTTGEYRFYENGAFRVVSAEELAKLGTLNASPTNYTPTGATYAGHLEGVDSALGSISSDASGVTYTPAVNADWDGDADPGNVDDALDQLAERVDDNEIAIGNKAESSVVTEIDGNTNDLITLSGVAENSTDLGTFTGDIIPDASTKKAALQSLETELGTTRDNADALIALSGVAEGATNLGTFTGDTIPDASTQKAALQALETEVETKAADADVIKKDGSVDFTGDQSMGGNKLTNLAAPTAASDAARKADVDAASGGLLPKNPVNVATTGNITDLASGAPDTVDGETMVVGSRVLVWQQTDPIENGIYVVDTVGTGSNGAWSRASDFDDSPSTEVVGGNSVYVDAGTANGTTVFRLSGVGDLIVDTDDLNFVIYSRAEAIIGGDGLDKTGNTLSVNTGDGIQISSDAVAVDSSVTRADGSVAFTGDQSMGSNKITSLADGTNAGDAVNKSQLDTKLANVSEDTTPSLGGALDTSGNAILHDGDGVKRGNSASPSNLIEEEYIDSISLASSQTNSVIAALTFAHAAFEGMELVYKIKEASSGDVRIGTIRVVTNGTDVVLNDIATETNDTGITFDAVVNGSNINIRYSSGTNGATMRCDVKRIRA